MTDCVSKPLHFADLKRVLEAALGERTAVGGSAQV